MLQLHLPELLQKKAPSTVYVQELSLFSDNPSISSASSFQYMELLAL